MKDSETMSASLTALVVPIWKDVTASPLYHSRNDVQLEMAKTFGEDTLLLRTAKSYLILYLWRVNVMSSPKTVFPLNTAVHLAIDKPMYLSFQTFASETSYRLWSTVPTISDFIKNPTPLLMPFSQILTVEFVVFSTYLSGRTTWISMTVCSSTLVFCSSSLTFCSSTLVFCSSTLVYFSCTLTFCSSSSCAFIQWTHSEALQIELTLELEGIIQIRYQ